MKKNNTATTVTTNNNYDYTAYKSGNQTIIVWDNLANMMMGNALPAQGCRVLKEKGGKEKK